MRLHIHNEPGLFVFDVAAISAQLPECEITVSEDEDTLSRTIADAEILLTNKKHDIGALRPAAPALKWVQVTSAGVEAMLPTLPGDIRLTNASGVHAEKGGEFVLTSILLLNYRLPQFIEKQRARQWAPEHVRPLRGKTAVVLGSGSIGGAAITLLARQGMRVIAVNRSGKPAEDAAETVAMQALDGVLPGADFLVSTLPDTPHTRGMIGAAQLSALPDGAGVVSVGRAAVFDHEALLGELRSQRLGGAVLDVFPTEPMPADDPTWDVPGLVATPHCSVDDLDGYMERCTEIFLGNFAQYRAGERMQTEVEPASGY